MIPTLRGGRLWRIVSSRPASPHLNNNPVIHTAEREKGAAGPENV